MDVQSQIPNRPGAKDRHEQNFPSQHLGCSGRDRRANAFGFHCQITRGFLQENESELAKGTPEILRVCCNIAQGGKTILREWMVNDNAVFHPGNYSE